MDYRQRLLLCKVTIRVSSYKLQNLLVQLTGFWAGLTTGLSSNPCLLRSTHKLVHQSDKAARFKTTSSKTESSYLGSNAKTGENS